MSALSDALTDAKNSRSESIDAIQDRARDAGFPLHRATVAKYLAGDGSPRPPEATIRGLAAGFKLSEQKVRQLLALPPGESEPWVPPEESARLNRAQRAALDSLIKAFVKVPDSAANGHSPTIETPPSDPAPTPKTGLTADENGSGLGGRMDTATAGGPFRSTRRASQGSDDDAAGQEREPEHADPQI